MPNQYQQNLGAYATWAEQSVETNSLGPLPQTLEGGMVALGYLLPIGKHSCLHLLPSRSLLQPAMQHRCFAADRSGAIVKLLSAPGKHSLSLRSESGLLPGVG